MNRRDVLTLSGVVGATAAVVFGASVVGGGVSGVRTQEPNSELPVSAASSTPSTGNPVPGSSLPEGEAQAELIVSGDVDELLTTPQPRTLDGAIEGFVTSAHLMLTSDEVANEPEAALSTISEVLNVTDRELLKGFDRTGESAFLVRGGAYRILGHAGEADRPDKVMVEIVAPLQTDGSQRWLIVGGVVAYLDGRWQVESIRPSELPAQPEGNGNDLDKLSQEDQAAVLQGVGWKIFANSDG